MAFQIDQFMCRTDNFGVLLHDPESRETVLIDAPAEAPILDAVKRTGWMPTRIWTTHHHPDHVEANLALKERFGLRITGPRAEADRIPGLDEGVDDGQQFTFGGEQVRIVETPGHTAGHICFHMPGSGLLFAGDTLFAMGCGRVFEKPYPVMHESLSRLASLPPETTIYCGHEYTQANARFALTVDPENTALRKRAAEVDALRAEHKPTLPTTIAAELETNPFLRCGDASIRRHLGMADASDSDVFCELRRRKDRF